MPDVRVGLKPSQTTGSYRFESEMTKIPTIFAVSSGSGRAGVAVIRVSGPESAVLIKGLAGKLPPPRHFSLRKLFGSDGDLIDEAVVVWLPGPSSATGEDMAEFHVHGSAAVLSRLLKELNARPGCRLAEPGEFTRRAFANQKLGLMEVEGLGDLLSAESESQRRLALRQFSGESAALVETWRDTLIQALALVEAAIDFAEEDDVALRASKQARHSVGELLGELRAAMAVSERADSVRRGVRIVIAGAPNVGKSSLLNALLAREAAIVSPIAGTTRDVLESRWQVNGLGVALIDTAGLRSQTSDPIEREGIARAAQAISESDIVVWVSAAGEEDAPLPRAPDIEVINKIDLETETPASQSTAASSQACRISVKSGQGLDELRSLIGARVAALTDGLEHVAVVRERHRQAVSESIRFLNDSLTRSDEALEMMAQDMRNAAHSLALITGRVGVEDILGRIFHDFCVGK